MDKLYQQLNEQFTQDIFDNAEAKEKEAYKEQRKDQDEVLNTIAKVLLTYTIIDSVLNLGDNEKKSLETKFGLLFSEIAKRENKSEKILIDNILSDAVFDKYYTQSYIYSLGIDFKLKKLTQKEINDIVNKVVDRKVWSDRLWANKKQLEKLLNREIKEFLNGKTSVNDIEKKIKARFGQNAFNTKRLARSEVARCQLESNEVFADNIGIEWQVFTATLDNKTTEFCRNHDGEQYKRNDPKKPILPHHPFERSFYMNIPSKDWRPKIRSDNQLGQDVNWQSYQEWINQKSL